MVMRGSSKSGVLQSMASSIASVYPGASRNREIANKKPANLLHFQIDFR
jgi:hypothetical protein